MSEQNSPPQSTNALFGHVKGSQIFALIRAAAPRDPRCQKMVEARNALPKSGKFDWQALADAAEITLEDLVFLVHDLAQERARLQTGIQIAFATSRILNQQVKDALKPNARLDRKLFFDVAGYGVSGKNGLITINQQFPVQEQGEKQVGGMTIEQEDAPPLPPRSLRTVEQRLLEAKRIVRAEEAIPVEGSDGKSEMD